MTCPYCKETIALPYTTTVSSHNEDRIVVLVGCPFCMKPFGAFPAK